MNITNFIITETIIFLFLAFFIQKMFLSKINEPLFKIANIFFWGSLIILSILINTRKFLFFISTFLILIIVSILFLIKYNIKKFFKDKLYYGVYMLLGITFFGIFNFIIAKYFIYNIENTEAPMGDTGDIGEYGETGVYFLTENFAERCYVDLINHLENKYKEIKESNKVKYDNKEYQIKNYYLKNNIRRICYSKQFLDSFYLNSENNTLKTPECLMSYEKGAPNRRLCSIPDKYGNYKECNTDNDCLEVKDLEGVYRNKIENIKKEMEKWLKLILRNNCEEDIRLRNNLGGAVYEELVTKKVSEDPNAETVLNISGGNTDFESNLLYNSKIGNRFLNDYFQNDKYLDENLNTKVKSNPFIEIKKSHIWNYGISPKKCKM